MDVSKTATANKLVLQSFTSETINIKLNAASEPTTSAQYLLSPRELEVLRWLLEGKSNWEIGVILKISEWTVKNHVHHILKKLDASNRSHAVTRAMATGIIGYSDAHREF